MSIYHLVFYPSHSEAPSFVFYVEFGSSFILLLLALLFWSHLQFLSAMTRPADAHIVSLEKPFWVSGVH